MHVPHFLMSPISCNTANGFYSRKGASFSSRRTGAAAARPRPRLARRRTPWRTRSGPLFLAIGIDDDFHRDPFFTGLVPLGLDLLRLVSLRHQWLVSLRHQ